MDPDSVEDPDPELDPQDPQFFGPTGSGSIIDSGGSGSGSFPFLINVLSGLKCLQNNGTVPRRLFVTALQ